MLADPPTGAAPRAPAPDALAHLPPLLAALLTRRGVTNAAAAAAFLAPDYERDLHDPLTLHDMEAATARLHAAMAAGERIGVFSDYDCDGIPGGVIAHDFFRAVGYDNFTNYIPHRHYEGFGLSEAAVDKLAADGVTLIVTIDCGTSDVAAVAYAAGRGVDVIITDHHEPGTTLPAAVAIVNPKLGSYPFPHLCGAAVVWKLVQALITTGDFSLTPGWEKWWLDMVGVATVADMVPLVGENRALAHYGLQVLRKSRRPGLQQLLRKTRTNQRYLTEDDVGFTIGPRINAASRMDTPEDAFRLLAATDEGEAGAHVEHLEHLNNERKGVVAAMTKELHQRLKQLDTIPDVLVMGNPGWRPALVGLTANKLAEEYGRPVFLWGKDGNDTVKGSARAGGGVSVVRLMEAAADAFLEYGGHHASGGFSVKPEHVFTFDEALRDAYATLGEAAVVREVREPDADLALEDIFGEVVGHLRQLAPFGAENPKPLFAFRHVTPATVAAFGKTKEHLKLTFTTARGHVEALAFFATATSFSATPQVGAPCTVLAHIEESFFMGRLQTRLRIVEII